VAPAEVVVHRDRSKLIWSALLKTYDDFDRHNYLSFAAGLSFFFLLSLFPLLIFLSSLFAYVQVPFLFEQTLAIMGRVVPGEAMNVVQGVANDVLRNNPRLLSFGIGWAIFAASGGYSALITILNIAYGVPEGRPYWKKRLIACGLTLLTGAMILVALIATVLGPEFGNWVAAHIEVGRLPHAWWPFLRWTLITFFAVLSVEAIYFLAPNVRQRFVDQVPGAAVAVLSWITASWALSWYLRQFAHYAQTFGALAAVVGLMMWFYVTALALILGAEINAELCAAKGKAIPEKELPKPSTGLSATHTTAMKKSA